MQPRKDYDDYSRFINDTYTDDKIQMMTQTVEMEQGRGTFSKTYNPAATLRTYSEYKVKPNANTLKSGFGTAKHNRAMSDKGMSDVEKKMGQTFIDFDVKPKILESKIAQRDDFFNLSDGFKRIFAKDKEDLKMVVPIAGYGGHRRGDRSQNFFGKSFRESSLQSKKLQRDLQCPVTFKQ